MLERGAPVTVSRSFCPDLFQLFLRIETGTGFCPEQQDVTEPSKIMAFASFLLTLAMSLVHLQRLPRVMCERQGVGVL